MTNEILCNNRMY
uniref:Uncharacterized protein n=1 Tax=Anguilla anguilla TaxID=7936 RepID=A0A0E9VFY5_ANGAN